MSGYLDGTTEIVAIKLPKLGYSIENFSRLASIELSKMTGLQHNNIVNLRGSGIAAFKEQTVVTLDIPYLVFDYVPFGEVFDYVFYVGKFPENIARFYFKQLISAVQYLHSKGIAHRDLKLQNVLFDEHFNLKVADFGFATALGGLLQESLGTDGSKAPEIEEGRLYSGEAVDVFACGVILFTMLSRLVPFTNAKKHEKYYRYIAHNQLENFFKIHEVYAPDVFTPHLKSLLGGIFEYKAEARFSIADILAHPWMTDSNVATHEECKAFLSSKQCIVIEGFNEELKKASKEDEALSQRGITRR